jgi:hypothetical protein
MMVRVGVLWRAMQQEALLNFVSKSVISSKQDAAGKTYKRTYCKGWPAVDYPCCFNVIEATVCFLQGYNVLREISVVLDEAVQATAYVEECGWLAAVPHHLMFDDR